MGAMPDSLIGPLRQPGLLRHLVTSLLEAGLTAFLMTATAIDAAKAQAIASPFATVSQKVDSTTITIEYLRPWPDVIRLARPVGKSLDTGGELGDDSRRGS